MNTRTVSIVALIAGLIVAGIGAAMIVNQLSLGVQPWDPLLSDNVVFAKSLPLIVGLGIVVGLIQSLLHRGMRVERRADGALRRFSWGTVLTHWVNAIGFLLAIFTGSLQYLVGVLDVPPPLPLFLIYRIHYIGASAILFAASSFITHRLLIGDRRILPPLGRWLLHLRGLVAELPRPIGNLIALIVGINLRRPAPEAGQFKYYEKVVSFPIWAALLALIIVTGFIKVIRYIYPVPGLLLWWASFFHVAAMVMLAAKFLDHLRYVLAPSRWPMLVSMFTTWISAEYARRQHPAWYREAEPSASRPTPAEAVAPAVEQAKARG